MNEWQPIETAPKDGVWEEWEGDRWEQGPHLIVTDGFDVTIGHFEDGNLYVAEGGDFDATHWMLAPTPPRPSTQTEAAE